MEEDCWLNDIYSFFVFEEKKNKKNSVCSEFVGQQSDGSLTAFDWLILSVYGQCNIEVIEELS